MCLAVLLVWVLITLPVLALAVVVPAVVLCRKEAQVSRWQCVAMTDAGTGLLNSYGWRQRTGSVLTVAAPHRGVGTAVVLVDVDHFKWINDRFGHLAGDAALAAVGATVARSVRDGDTVARIGGDEFAVALPGVTVAELSGVVERLRVAVVALRVPLPDGVVTGLSVSVGAAICLTDVATVRDLVAAADSALYDAKAGGRNRLRVVVVTSGDNREGSAGKAASLPG